MIAMISDILPGAVQLEVDVGVKVVSVLLRVYSQIVRLRAMKLSFQIQFQRPNVQSLRQGHSLT